MIKNFDDRFRMQRLGKIRLGVKKTSKNGKEYPAAVDYFVCPPEVQKIYGEKPRVLDIMIPHDNIEAVFPTALKMYGSQKGLICRGDGEKASRRQEGSNNWEEIDCPYQDCQYYKQGYCREVGNLQVILPKVKGMLGIYQIDTSSYNSILNIKSSLEMLKQTVGRCSLIPLKLEVKMQQANPLTAGGGRLKTTVPVMYIKLDYTFNEVIEMARERKLIQQVRIKSPQIIEIDNPGIDEKPELLYPETMLEGEPSSSEYEVYAADPIDEELNQAWDILGTPEAWRKAVLGKPDLNKRELLQQLKAEIDALSKDEEEEISRRQQNLFF